MVFDTGRAALDGHADFLSVPYPGVHAFYKVQNIPLDRLRPFGERANLTLTGRHPLLAGARSNTVRGTARRGSPT